MTKNVTGVTLLAVMGNVNSLKGILLFAVRNGYREVRISKGLLPLMVSSQGEKAYINGIAPVSGELITSIKRDYLANNPSLILTVSEQEFFASSVGEDIVFKHLPLVTQDKNINTKFASALYAKRGIIVLTAIDKEQRALKLFKAAAYVTENRSSTIVVIERSKFFSVKSSHSRIINIYRPEVELNSLIRMTSALDYDCIMVPDMNEHDAINTLEFIAGEKMVLLSTTWEMAQKISSDKVIYSDYIDAEQQSQSTKPNVRVNQEVLSENLKGE